MLTDREERARANAVEQRISEPLRFPILSDAVSAAVPVVSAAVPAVAAAVRGIPAAVRGILTRRPRGAVQGRESLSCQPTPPPAPPR
ncbi:hypothetical protein ABT144_30885 [Streptomyces sp. NPDC002039]|uniref:hypothetical protein n=1 Tax=unclassified Streptomyces TaxID=2593676 RepID=UPI00332669D4